MSQREDRSRYDDFCDTSTGCILLIATQDADALSTTWEMSGGMSDDTDLDGTTQVPGQSPELTVWLTENLGHPTGEFTSREHYVNT
ncbi:hypothetical protein Taro_022136 [Colocasia esculenta]|uniref:Uncharacterized protein n=1 Tax=Colocasia esculenta TaxID=4460 RepID=A0A843V4I1_COLES|nr:hypothetical protein [Colocasia esculenta]